jgi:integrase
MTRRSYGTGSLLQRTDSAGNVSWYGSWWVDGRRVKRRIGPKRTGAAKGLTKAQAELQLRNLMHSETPALARQDRLTLAEAARLYERHLESTGKPRSGQKRKRTTLAAVESAFRVWLDPHLGDRALDSVTAADVENLKAAMEDADLGPKSIRNYMGTLSALYRFAIHPKRGWARANPVDEIELPALEQSDEIRHLSVQEVEALASAAVKGEYQALDLALYLTAAMTGLRQGELLALRWSDVDWGAQRIRVRRSYVLGAFDTPKSRRGSRSVPMSKRVARELDRWHQTTQHGGEKALVFAEPATGEVLRRRALMRRYHRALKAAQLDESHRFHDLRHTFGTRMASAGVDMRRLQVMMGHRDLKTTLIYADYVPSAEEVAFADEAFADELAADRRARARSG